jgi:hypothetical protein
MKVPMILALNLLVPQDHVLVAARLYENKTTSHKTHI